jgi:hypothetical protein
MVRKEEREAEKQILFREFWGVNKRANALETINEDGTLNTNNTYQKANPTKQNRYSFRPSNVGADYQSWLKIDEIALENYVGLEECRGGALIDIDANPLRNRMQSYFDKNISWETLTSISKELTKDMAGFDAKKTRDKVLEKEKTYDENKLVKLAIRPFELRYCYYSSTNPLWNRSRPALWKQLKKANGENQLFLITRFNAQANPEGVPFCIAKNLFDKQMISRNPAAFAFSLTYRKEETKANLSAKARAYLEKLGLTDADENAETASLVWFHALAVGYSPLYLSENADGIRQDFPRVPLPAKLEDLQNSARLGKRIAALLDTETAAANVTAGKLDFPFASMGALAHVENLQLNAADFEITAGWGHAGKGNVTMPGKGKLVEREYMEIETNALQETAERLNVTLEDVKQTLGSSTVDVYLNNSAYWRNVPRNVWEYTIGGYQVMKKWLSYRESELLGRALNLAEANEGRDIARRISAILLSSGELDKNYLTAKVSNAVTNDAQGK